MQSGILLQMINTIVKKNQRSAKKEARPKEIILAALSVFESNGFAATRLEDVAHFAKISKGTIYLYFDNKEELFKACVRETVGKPIEETLGIANKFDGSTEKLLHEIADKIGNTFSNPEYRSIFYLIVSEGKRFPELVSFYYEEVVMPGIKGLSNIIERGIKRGEIKKSKPEEQALMLISPVIFSNIWNRLFITKKIDLGETLHSYINIWLDGMRYK